MRSLSLAAAALLLPFSLEARAGLPTYEVRFLGDGTPAAVNDLGQAALNRAGRAWFADVGAAAIELPLPTGADASVATDMNTSGWVVGDVSGAAIGTRAVIWKPTGPGTWSITIIPASADSHASAVNDPGDVVGWITGNGGYVFDTAGVLVPLISLGFSPLPEDISNERVVVGRNIGGTSERMDLDTLVVEDLGLPTGTGLNYQAVTLGALNASGVVTGAAFVATGQPDDVQAVRYSDTDGWAALNSPLPAAGGLAVDAAGNTLFFANHTSPALVHFVGEGTHSLDTLLEPGSSGWSLFLTTGGDMSANGIVVCTGGNTGEGRSGVVVVSPVVASQTFCNASDGALAACPCADPGAPDTGCDNAQGTGGVRLSVLSQSTVPNAALLQATGFPAATLPTAILIRSAALDASSPVVFGDGLRCVATDSLVRMDATFASGGSATHAVGHGVAAGSGTFYYQTWYRNEPAGFCDAGAAFNLSSGATLDWP